MAAMPSESSGAASRMASEREFLILTRSMGGRCSGGNARQYTDDARPGSTWLRAIAADSRRSRSLTLSKSLIKGGILSLAVVQYSSRGDLCTREAVFAD